MNCIYCAVGLKKDSGFPLVGNASMAASLCASIAVISANCRASIFAISSSRFLFLYFISSTFWFFSRRASCWSQYRISWGSEEYFGKCAQMNYIWSRLGDYQSQQVKKDAGLSCVGLSAISYSDGLNSGTSRASLWFAKGFDRTLDNSNGCGIFGI